MTANADYTLPESLAEGTLSVEIQNASGKSYGLATVNVPAASADLSVGNVRVERTATGTEGILDTQSISINSEKKITIKGGEKKTFTCLSTPAGALTDLAWMSTNHAVATVDNGIVSASGEGEADIIAVHSDMDGNIISRDSVHVTVEEGISCPKKSWYESTFRNQ